MPTTSKLADDGVRRRPRNRKAQIASVAAEAFSTRGYYAVGMDDIAAELDISATALYRHYANKYELFRGAVLTLSQQMVDATAFFDEVSEPSPESEAELIAALADYAIDMRTRGGLYRWEKRHLQPEDQAELVAQMTLVNRRVQRTIIARRSTVSSYQRWMLSVAALSVIGSVADHRARLSSAAIRELLTHLVGMVLSTDIPDGPLRSQAIEPVDTRTPRDRREALLQIALNLFYRNGYHPTAMGDIAAGAGIPTSAIYRYFTGKQDILTATLRPVMQQIGDELDAIPMAVADPASALRELVRVYVANSFANPQLAHVYYAERLNLTAPDQRVLRVLQSDTVATWVQLLCAARPDISATVARFTVHAAMAVVVDLGWVQPYAGDHMQPAVRRLMLAVLGISESA